PHSTPAHGPTVGGRFHLHAACAGIRSRAGRLLLMDIPYCIPPDLLTPLQGEWRPFPGDARYEVCSLGAVRNARSGRVLKPWLAGYGYWYVQLGAKGLKTGIHRLVALTFLGPPPSRQHEVAHNDGNRANNIVTNLRWATHAENVADTFRHGTAKVPVYRGQNHPRATLTEPQVREIRSRYCGRRGEQAQLAREYGVSHYVIHHIVRGESWSHLN
ncbi:HNH endonuclease signature motif containing protein, partial [Ralstonia pseudosolanacearum]